MKKIVKTVVIIVVCLAAAAAGVIYYLTPDTLEVTTVSKGTISPRLSGTGTVEGNRKITVYSDVSGVIGERFVENGDRVKKGDLLVGYTGESQQNEMDLAATDMVFSEKIFEAASDNRAKYQSINYSAKKKIAECEQVYGLLELQMMQLNSGAYLSDYEMNQRKKSIEADIAKKQGEIADQQAKLAKVEADMKGIELKGNDEDDDDDDDDHDVDHYVKKAKRYQDEIMELNESISKLQRDAICLPQEGMDPATHDRYLVLQNNLDTVMRIWTDAKNDRDTSQSMLTAYQEIYADEQQVERNKLSFIQAEKELQKAVNGGVAPADGIITQCLIDVGAFVDKGAPVLEMQTADGYKVSMMVSKYDIARVREGLPANIKIGDIQYTGKVSKINQAARNDSSGKAKASVEIDVDTADDLIVGLDADVTLIFDDVENILRVPSECVYTDDDGSFVYITDENSEVKKEYVTVGLNDSLYTQIEGLSEGTHIIDDPDAANYVGEKIKEEFKEE